MIRAPFVLVRFERELTLCVTELSCQIQGFFRSRIRNHNFSIQNDRINVADRKLKIFYTYSYTRDSTKMKSRYLTKLIKIIKNWAGQMGCWATYMRQRVNHMHRVQESAFKRMICKQKRKETMLHRQASRWHNRPFLGLNYDVRELSRSPDIRDGLAWCIFTFLLTAAENSVQKFETTDEIPAGRRHECINFISAQLAASPQNFDITDGIPALPPRFLEFLRRSEKCPDD